MPSFLTSPLLETAGFRHGFFTRVGGVSSAPWDTLNFGVATGDEEKAAVRENRARAARALGVEGGRLYFMSQVHGTAVGVFSGEERWEDAVRREGDIAVSRTPGVACGVRSADCVTVLVADRESGGVAAIHSGWRGTVRGAAGAGVLALRELVGAKGAGGFVAAIGPHIEACCFEVGDDVAKELAGASDLGEGAVIPGGDGAPARVDLRAIVRAQLLAAGLEGGSIDDVPGCTVCDAVRFFSYRRDGARSGRLLSAIVARGDAR